MPYSQRYLFNAIPDTNHNANPTSPNRYSKGNPNPTNPTNPTNPNTRYRIIEPSDYWTLGLSIHYRVAVNYTELRTVLVCWTVTFLTVETESLCCRWERERTVAGVGGPLNKIHPNKINVFVTEFRKKRTSEGERLWRDDS